MPPGTLELELPPELDAGGAVALLESQLDVSPGRRRTEQRVLLDTFDARLRAARLRAERADGRGAELELVLTEAGTPPRRALVGRTRRLLATELPPGPLRERLAPVLEERALLGLAHVRRSVQPVAVLNADAKTVVRLELEQATVRGADGASVTLPPRLRARPVRGYEKEHARVAGVLTGPLGLRPADEDAFDLAVRAAGGRPEGTTSRVGVTLEPGMRADAAAAAVLLRLADVAESNVEGTLQDLDPEFLHDLRVAVRRARSVLRELQGVHDPSDRAHLREELKWVQAVTGPLRDLDVWLLDWEELTAGLREDRHADLAPLHGLLLERRAKALRDLRRELRSKRFGAALAAWRALAAAPPATGPDLPALAGRAIEDLAADRIRRVHRRMVRDGLRIDDASPDEALHELRKRGKELRYLLELFGGLFPKRVVKPMVAALKDLQDVLGRFQDRAVQVALLRGLGRELARTEAGPDALMALGLVVEALERDQHDARAHFAERFSAFAAGDQRALVRETFARLDA